MDVERECSVIRDWRYIMWMWRGNVVLSETGDISCGCGEGILVLSETGDISCGCGEGM